MALFPNNRLIYHSLTSGAMGAACGCSAQPGAENEGFIGSFVASVTEACCSPTKEKARDLYGSTKDVSVGAVSGVRGRALLLSL